MSFTRFLISMALVNFVIFTFSINLANGQSSFAGVRKVVGRILPLLQGQARRPVNLPSSPPRLPRRLFSLRSHDLSNKDNKTARNQLVKNEEFLKKFRGLSIYLGSWNVPSRHTEISRIPFSPFCNNSDQKNYFSNEIGMSDCQITGGDCSYYQCREKERSCGLQGYFVSVGHRFCEYFLDTNVSEKFSENGKGWLSRVRMCLQTHLSSLSLSNSCHKIAEKAYSHHFECYLQEGFCELSSKDQLRLIRHLRLEIFRPEFLFQGYRLVQYCLKKKV